VSENAVAHADLVLSSAADTSLVRAVTDTASPGTRSVDDPQRLDLGSS
jgi:hypothetical protein